MELAESVNLSKYNVYGLEMARLVNRINSDEHWIKKPRGPLASCITVRDPKWVHLVECILSEHLCCFAVDNKDDAKLLNRMIEDFFKRVPRNGVLSPSIYLMSFGEKKMETHGQEPQYGFPTILDVLDITGNDYVVFNWVIDLAGVERKFLFETYTEACNFMKARSHQTGQNLRGYSLEGYEIHPYPNLKVLDLEIKPVGFLKVTEDTLVA